MGPFAVENSKKTVEKAATLSPTVASVVIPRSSGGGLRSPHAFRVCALGGRGGSCADEKDVRDSRGVAGVLHGEREKMTTGAITGAADLEELLAAFSSSAAGLIEDGQAFVVLIDPTTGYPDLAAFRAANQLAPVQLCTLDFQQHYDLFKRLARGEHVTITDSTDLLLPQHGGEEPGPYTLLLIPVISTSGLEALLCLAFPAHRPAPSPAALECMRQLCRQAAPLLVRMRELEVLRKKNAELIQLLQGSAEPESVAGLLQAKNELEAIVEIKSHLVANLVHELRTPLVAVRGYTKMILEGRAGQINSTQRDYLTIVAENANRLVNLINNLVNFTASQQLRLQALDLRGLGLDSLRRIRPLAMQKAVRIKVNIAAEPFTIMGDKEKLAQVFDDLLMNAVKFTDGGGEIVVEFSRGDEDEVSVKVSDTGVGIPPGLLDKIFDRYSQADRPAARGKDRLVAGLSSVHDIIRLHGGRISVASKVGEGSTFIFTLPAIKARRPQEVIPSHDQASSSSSGR